MRIAQITPGLLPIPPNGWGAVEKIIWHYKQELEKQGHTCDIKYPNEINPGDYDIVHVHVANQALMLAERGIPYIFSFHDHHAYLHGKQSQNYKENQDAVDRALHTLVPAKYLVDYFGPDRVSYFSHGVDTGLFNPDIDVHTGVPEITRHALLCVANNGWAHDPAYDRKGFTYAIEAAKILDLPITIVGPENNKHFFEANPELASYSRLTIKYSLTEEELAREYNDKSIFLHPSELEAGHPNLTLLEAMASGLPVVGTYEDDSLKGLVRVERNTTSVITGIAKTITNYNSLRRQAYQQANKLSWGKRVEELVKQYQVYLKPMTPGNGCISTTLSPMGYKSDRGHIYYTLSGKQIDLRNYDYNQSQGDVERKYGWEACMYWANIYHHELDNEYFGVEPGDIYLDLGANIGMNCTYAELKGAKVYAVEPDPAVYECLVKNSGGWDCINAAVSDKSGPVTITKWPGTETIEVPASTLETLLERFCLSKVDYLKIDIEGAEKYVIPAIKPETWQKIQKVFIEYHEDHFAYSDEERGRFMNIFKRHGFKVAVKTGPHQSWIYAWKNDKKKEPLPMKEALIQAYETTQVNSTPVPVFTDPTINVHFVHGGTVDIKGGNPSHTYQVDFINKDSGQSVYNTTISSGNYAKTAAQYYVPYRVEILNLVTGKQIIHDMDLKGKRVAITLDSASMGDTLAWLPYVEEFRKQHDCHLIVSSFLNDHVRDVYPEIEWVNPGTFLENIYAWYTIGWYYNDDQTIDLNKNKIDFKSWPLQRTASEILGLEYKEVKPRLNYKFGISTRPIAGKYVCIANHSTLRMKYWNYENGWQTVVDHLKEKGYKVVNLSKEAQGHGILNDWQRTQTLNGVKYPADYNVQTIMWHLYHCDFFIGLGSGLSWLSWAMNKPTVLIAGMSEPYTEMQDCIRIFTPDGNCRSCFNWIRHQHDGNWDACPKHWRSERAFQCTTSITPEMVIPKIDSIIQTTIKK